MHLDDLETKRWARDALADQAQDDDDDAASERLRRAADALANEAAQELCENEAACLAGKPRARGDDAEALSTLDKAFTATKHFRMLSGACKTRLADALASNLSVLNAAIDAACHDARDDEESGSDIRTLRDALRVHVALIVRVVEDVAAVGPTSGNDGAPSHRRKGRGGKASGAPAGGAWCWTATLDKLLRPLACTAGLDLAAVCSCQATGAASAGGDGLGLVMAEDLTKALTRAALRVLNTPAALAASGQAQTLRESLLRLVALAAVACGRHYAARQGPVAAVAPAAPAGGEGEGGEGGEGEEEEAAPEGAAAAWAALESLVPALVDAVNKSEAAVPVVADAAQYAWQAMQSDALARALLNEIARVDPRAYRQQQQSDAQGVKNVATFLVCMAERVPASVAASLSVIVPHLGGEAYSMRSGVVAAIARVLVHYQSEAGSDGPSAVDCARGRAFLKSKQHFLSVLTERILDVSAFTRSKTLQTWAYLCERKAVPMGYWNHIAGMAVGRLEDKAALVRKSALHLLATMLQYNPFAPSLPVAKFETSLQEYRDKLDAAAAAADKARGGEDGAAGDGADVDADEEAEEEEDPALSQLRALVASLDAAVQFCRHLSGSLTTVAQLLASSSVTDVNEAISYIVLLCQFSVDKASGAARKILPLIFSNEQTVKDGVIDGFAQLYAREETDATAVTLSKLVVTLNVGELTSLAPIFSSLWSKGIVHGALVDELLHLLKSPNTDVRIKQGALHLCSLVAAVDPEVVVDNIGTIVAVGFGPDARRNPYIARAACCALMESAKARPVETRAALGPRHAVFGHLVRLVSGRDGAVPLALWYSVAEACIACLYALHPQPELVLSVTLQSMAKALTDSKNNETTTDDVEYGLRHVSSVAAARFFFATGQVALKHLVHLEGLGSAVRQRQSESHGGKGKAEGGADAADIGEEVGASAAVAADAALDALLEDAEREMSRGQHIIALAAPLLTAVCKDARMLMADANLRAAAVLCLTKLMCLDANFCEANLPLLFSMLSNRAGMESEIRSNVVIALGDLVYRWPNTLEPWTRHVYSALEDPDAKVRKHALMVLSHLILNDMLKVKGHVSTIAKLLLDPTPRIASLAELFFHELSRKTATTVYNLVPDILSNLSRDASVDREGFRHIMTHVLAFIQRDRQTDSLVDKLCARFDACGDTGASLNRCIAFCLASLNVTERGLKHLCENFKTYKFVFEDDEVVQSFHALLAKAKKLVTNRQSIHSLTKQLGAMITEEVGAAAEEGEENGEENGEEGEGNDENVGDEGGRQAQGKRLSDAAPPPHEGRALRSLANNEAAS